VRVDPARAESVLEDLSQLFRVALAEPGVAVTVQDELDLVRRYLAIEQVRFGDRLTVQWQIDPRITRARIPPLVLQPLVENAVRHGIEPAAGGGKLLFADWCSAGRPCWSSSTRWERAPERRAMAWRCTTCAKGCACCTTWARSATSGASPGWVGARICSTPASCCRCEGAARR
jgi:hypothetical protein